MGVVANLVCATGTFASNAKYIIQNLSTDVFQSGGHSHSCRWPRKAVHARASKLGPLMSLCKVVAENLNHNCGAWFGRQERTGQVKWVYLTTALFFREDKRVFSALTFLVFRWLSQVSLGQAPGGSAVKAAWARCPHIVPSSSPLSTPPYPLSLSPPPLVPHPHVVPQPPCCPLPPCCPHPHVLGPIYGIDIRQSTTSLTGQLVPRLQVHTNELGTSHCSCLEHCFPCLRRLSCWRSQNTTETVWLKQITLRHLRKYVYTSFIVRIKLNLDFLGLFWCG